MLEFGKHFEDVLFIDFVPWTYSFTTLPHDHRSWPFCKYVLSFLELECFIIGRIIINDKILNIFVKYNKILYSIGVYY